MSSEAEYREQLDRIERQLSDLYRERRAVQAEFSAEHEPVLPPPRYRSETQQKVARCPRCGGRLDSDEPGAKK